jgi:Holliday junction resolvase RusA-like endonuclease
MLTASEAAATAVDRPFAPPLECVVDLPPPPSVNVTRRVNGAGQRKLQKWKHQAGMAVMVAGGLRRLTKMPGRFEATIILDEQQNRLDLDNAAKCLIDYAKKLGLILDDAPKFMRRVTIEWGDAPHGARLILRSVI